MMVALLLVLALRTLDVPDFQNVGVCRGRRNKQLIDLIVEIRRRKGLK
jgi:hypothetical protein